MDSMEFLLTYSRSEFYSYFATYIIIYRWKTFIAISQACNLGEGYIHTHRVRGTSVFCEQICLEGHVKLSYKATLGTGTWHKQLAGSNALNPSSLFCTPRLKWFKSSVWRAEADRHKLVLTKLDLCITSAWWSKPPFSSPFYFRAGTGSLRYTDLFD